MREVEDPEPRHAELYNYHVYNQYVIRIPDREAVMERLKKEEIGYEVYYPLPLHLQKAFASLGGKLGGFSESEQAAKEVLAIPVYPELTEEQKNLIVATVKGS